MCQEIGRTARSTAILPFFEESEKSCKCSLSVFSSGAVCPNICGSLTMEFRATDGTEEESEVPVSESEIFPTYQINSPIGSVTGPELIGRIIKTALGIVGALALLMFIYGGFTWLTSGGSSDKIEKGRNILTWATIGMVVVFASYTLVDFLLRAFGL
jgi:hypothetical protein